MSPRKSMLQGQGYSEGVIVGEFDEARGKGEMRLLRVLVLSLLSHTGRITALRSVCYFPSQMVGSKRSRVGLTHCPKQICAGNSIVAR